MASKKELDRHISKLLKGKPLEESDAKALGEMAKEILVEEDNVLQLSAPITVVGDVHAQFYDVVKILEIGGSPPGTSYLWLGDFVDRGYYGVETFLLLLAYKVRYPSKVYLMRGNHESKQITQVYGFYDEGVRKYGSANVWNYGNEVFDLLPLAAVIDEKVFCVHGGLSPSLKTIDEISEIDRNREIPYFGLMGDLMWSDPEEKAKGWNDNPRGAGSGFGKDVVDKFNRDNSIDYILRSHQLVMEGYNEMFSDQLFTIWSAPNYGYRGGNKASILNVDSSLERNFEVFDANSEQQEPTEFITLPKYFM